VKPEVACRQLEAERPVAGAQGTEADRPSFGAGGVAPTGVNFGSDALTTEVSIASLRRSARPQWLCVSGRPEPRVMGELYETEEAALRRWTGRLPQRARIGVGIALGVLCRYRIACATALLPAEMTE